jgi:ketosteroid isomerase-like protein
MSTEKNRALVTRFFEEVCNGRKLEVADQIFSTGHAYHDPQIPTGPGPLGMKQVISTYQKAYGDARWTVEETLDAGDDVVVTRWIGSGTQTGELMGIAPTQKKVRVSGIWIHKISGGRIVESWNHWDVLGMLQQLGVVPAMTENKR